MADTVKKSRIVSEDDLEESLMQEFNMRLQTCMSSDNINEDNEENFYENVDITNGGTNFKTQNGFSNGRKDTDETDPNEDFIQKERECNLSEQSDLNILDNKIIVISEADSKDLGENHEIINLEDNLENKEQLEIIETLETSEPVVYESKSVKDRMFLSTDSASCLLFTQTITSPMLTPSEERVDFIKGFQESSDNTISDEMSPKSDDILQGQHTPEEILEDIEAQKVASEISEIEINEQNIYENQEIIDKTNIYKNKEIFAQLDDHQSEEITTEPIYENQRTIMEQLSGNQEVYEELKIENKSDTEEVVTKENIIYENLNIYEDQNLDENQESYLNKEIMENEETVLEKHTKSSEIIEKESPSEKMYENSIKNDIKSVDLLRDVPNNKVCNENNPKQKYIDTISKEPNKETSLVINECKIPSIKSLKDQYIMTASSENTKVSNEKSDITTLKSLDIMKQINKFEQISPNETSESSTETTETSTYVETTTVETKSSGQEGKSLKKKKSKKSRNHHEKENISVTDSCDSYSEKSEENFYNVNVKSLCRSFGDLTKIGDDKNKNEVKTRTKSMSDIRTLGTIGKPLENVFNGVSVKALRDKFSNPATTNSSIRINLMNNREDLKSSFSKFDALQKKNVLHVRSTDSSKAQEKFNGNQIDNTNCKSCGKIVFQMEQMKAEKSIWHKNCFRCNECSKQLTVDTYQSHEGTLYCKPHFKALFAPKVVEDVSPPKPRKHEMIIRENQPEELPPDVVRASDKPDLGLEELHSLNVKERYQVFEHHEDDLNNLERTSSAVNVKRSPSILSKLAKFQAKGMDIGVADESLNGIPLEESSSEEEQELEEGEDADLIRAKRAQKEKPFHFVGMSDVKSKWENGDQTGKDERREERKQEIQSIRNRLFMGKQGKMKEAYQQAVMDSEMGAHVKKSETIEAADTRFLKERFEKGPISGDVKEIRSDSEDMAVFESGICKKSRSIFLELDANAAKAPSVSPVSPQRNNEVRKAREVFLERQASEDVVKSTQTIEDVTVQTADIQQRFKFFETFKEPEKQRKVFRITPPREGQVKVDSPEREVYRDPDVVRSEECIEDSVVAQKTQTAKKMLNKFRQMEEDLSKDQVPLGPKPLKRFTPPPEPIRSETESEEDVSESEEESEEEDAIDHSRIPDEDLLEAQKAARAKQLRAKFEKWEANEIKREQNMSSVNIVEEFGEEQSQIESTRSLRARFESLKEGSQNENKSPKIKVNRFVDTTSALELCQDCKTKVYPLEKISVHGAIYHKKCFKCMECHTILRMDSYSYNQGLLYCTPHFKRLFISKGNYDTAFGLEQHKEKWNTTMA